VSIHGGYRDTANLGEACSTADWDGDMGMSKFAWLLLAPAVVGCQMTTPAVEDPAPTTPAALDEVDRAAMNQDEQAAVDAVDGFWRRNSEAVLGEQYLPPRVAGPYVGADGPTCGGEPSVAFNAFYCQPGDFLAWDQNLMAAGYNQIGDAWVYLIIAHEWGHAIQARLNADLVSVAAELQADCFAGAALQGAANDGVLTFEPGDSEELAQTLAAVADDYPWTNERDHGDVQQRTEAFSTGASGGVAACIK
jgi:predicted metalloprotease